MLISPSTLQVDQPSSCHINTTRHPGPSLWLQIERQLMICKTVFIRRSTTFFVIGLTLYSLCPSWVPSCGLRLGAAAEHEIYESLSVCLPSRISIFHLLKTCHPVSSGVSRMRSVALCPHGITMQIGQWNLPQGNLSLRLNVSSNYAQPTSTVTRTHQMHLVGWCELCHMVIVLKQMCRSWMCPRGTWELS